MSWTDEHILEVIKKLRDEFNVSTFVETGTFKGINAFVQANNFKHVITCEKVESNYLIAKDRLKNKPNVKVVHEDSSEFLRKFVIDYKKNKLKETVIIYLDAHFYDPTAIDKFVVLNELKALQGFKNAIIIIHDYDNGMGHICYDGVHLGNDLIREDITKVNKKFVYYTNEPENSKVFTEINLDKIGLEKDKDAIDNIRYAWTSERLTKRGLLFALPRKINKHKYQLSPWNLDSKGK